MKLKKFRSALGILASATIVGASLGAAILAPPASADTGTVLGSSEVSYIGEAGGIFGTAVSKTSCDVNGDGNADTIVGDWRWSRPGYNMTGAGYVLLGEDELGGGYVDEPNNSNTIRIDGPSATVTGGAWVGWSVSCLGDVNGDGIDDFVLGTGSRSYHEVHVIFGSKQLGSIDLDFLGSNGFIIKDTGANDKVGGDKSTDNFGYSVSAVGDINGDGLADVGVSDLLADDHDRANSGRSWIISGSASARTVDVDSPASAARVLMTVDGANANDRTANLAPLGDVNGDGLDDIGTSAYTAKVWGDDASVPGAGYVIFGSKDTAQIDLASLGSAGFSVLGPKRGADRLGMSIAAAGDVNGDGLADVVLGADGVNSAEVAHNGGAAIVYGSAATATVYTAPDAQTNSVYTCATEGDGCDDSQARGFWVNGTTAGSRLGVSVSSLADLNGDGARELVLGGSSAGTWIVYGDAERTATLNLADADVNQAVTVSTTLGGSVGSAGDMDRNGTEDIVAGGSNKVSILLLNAAGYDLTLDAPEKVTAGEQFTVTAQLTGSALPSDTNRGTVSISVDGQPVEKCTDLAMNHQVTCDLSISPTQDEPADAAKIDAATPKNEALVSVAFTPAEGSKLGKLSDSTTITVKAAEVPEESAPATASPSAPSGEPEPEESATASPSVPSGEPDPEVSAPATAVPSVPSDEPEPEASVTAVPSAPASPSAPSSEPVPEDSASSTETSLSSTTSAGGAGESESTSPEASMSSDPSKGGLASTGANGLLSYWVMGLSLLAVGGLVLAKRRARPKRH